MNIGIIRVPFVILRGTRFRSPPSLRLFCKSKLFIYVASFSQGDVAILRAIRAIICTVIQVKSADTWAYFFVLRAQLIHLHVGKLSCILAVNRSIIIDGWEQ